MDYYINNKISGVRRIASKWTVLLVIGCWTRLIETYT